MSEIKYPNISVKLIGEDGNVFAIIGRVTAALRKGGVSKEEIDDFTKKCFSAGSYGEVLGLVMEMVEVEDDDDDEGNYLEDEDDLEDEEDEEDDFFDDLEDEDEE